jgi:hypothetical protein
MQTEVLQSKNCTIKPRWEDVRLLPTSTNVFENQSHQRPK